MSDPLQSFRLAILASLGHAPEAIEPGRFQRFPTSERRGDSAGWCKLFDDMRGGVFGCYRLGVRESWSAADRAAMTRQQRADLARQVMAATAEREAQQRQQWADNGRRIARLWSECVPLVPGDPVTLYLKRRGLGGVWPLSPALRLHRALPYWQGTDKVGTFPAMVAPLVAPDGRVVSLHRTYLHKDGRPVLRDGRKVRKLVPPAGPLAGACIPLHPLARARILGIAEGIETALASWCVSGVPTVAAYCAGNLAAWRWPPGLQRLVIFADADKAGRDAADELRARALAAGLQVNVLTPTTEGEDWCDVWASHGGAALGKADAQTRRQEGTA